MPSYDLIRIWVKKSVDTPIMVIYNKVMMQQQNIGNGEKTMGSNHTITHNGAGWIVTWWLPTLGIYHQDTTVYETRQDAQDMMDAWDV